MTAHVPEFPSTARSELLLPEVWLWTLDLPRLGVTFNSGQRENYEIDLLDLSNVGGTVCVDISGRDCC